MSESVLYSAMELREYIEGNHSKENKHLNVHGGLVEDEGILEIMNYMESRWPKIREHIKNRNEGGRKNKSVDENRLKSTREGCSKNKRRFGVPESFEDSRMGKTLRKNQATKRANSAVLNKNASVMKNIVGWNEMNVDASGISVLNMLRKRVRQPGYTCYIFGKLGSGKTDFALLLSEVWKMETSGMIGSNIKSLEEKDELIMCFSDLKEWVSNGGKKLFVFDEASSHASGYAGQAHSARKLLGRLLRKFRKNSTALIIIGHTGKDIHPDIRRLVVDKIEKVSKKEAKFWEKLDDGKGEDVELKLSSIPKTALSYDTKEESDWSWD